MSAAKAVKISGDLTIGDGAATKLFLATAIRPYGDEAKLDLLISSDSRHVRIAMDRASAIALANRILDEVECGTLDRAFSVERR